MKIKDICPGSSSPSVSRASRCASRCSRPYKSLTKLPTRGRGLRCPSSSGRLARFLARLALPRSGCPHADFVTTKRRAQGDHRFYSTRVPLRISMRPWWRNTSLAPPSINITPPSGSIKPPSVESFALNNSRASAKRKASMEVIDASLKKWPRA
jgi:hypothetical protein